MINRYHDIATALLEMRYNQFLITIRPRCNIKVCNNTWIIVIYIAMHDTNDLVACIAVFKQRKLQNVQIIYTRLSELC